MYYVHQHDRARGRPTRRDFRRLVESLPESLLVVRPDAPRFTIIDASDAYLRATSTARYGPRGIVGHALFDAFPPSPNPYGDAAEERLRSSLVRAIATRAADAMEMHRYDVTLDGGERAERYCSPVNVPVVGDDGRVVYVIHRVDDVTTVARLHSRAAAAERASALAEEANAAKMRFLASMSHELRTPLNAIAGYVDLMLLGVYGDITPEQRAALDRVQRSEQYLLGLINEVLSYAKLESGHLVLERRCVVLREAVDDVLALVAPQAAAKELTLQASATIADGGELELFADGEKVRQILLNLVMNAVKFSARGSRVSIECSATGGAMPGGDVMVRVIDAGVGIAPDEMAKLFEPFVQVGARSTMREGTGLGLSISRGLARAMGGEITAMSVAGAGSVFTLTLPRYETARRRTA